MVLARFEEKKKMQMDMFGYVIATLEKWGMDDLVRWSKECGLERQSARQRLREELARVIFDCSVLYDELSEDRSAVDAYVSDLADVADRLEAEDTVAAQK
jgi:hypothetical protein